MAQKNASIISIQYKRGRLLVDSYWNSYVPWYHFVDLMEMEYIVFNFFLYISFFTLEMISIYCLSKSIISKFLKSLCQVYSWKII